MHRQSTHSSKNKAPRTYIDRCAGLSCAKHPIFTLWAPTLNCCSSSRNQVGNTRFSQMVCQQKRTTTNDRGSSKLVLAVLPLLVESPFCCTKHWYLSPENPSEPTPTARHVGIQLKNRFEQHLLGETCVYVFCWVDKRFRCLDDRHRLIGSGSRRVLTT